MKSRLLLIPLMLSAATAMADRTHTLGQHPAVLVAKTWNGRGIDANTLPMTHPALAASPTRDDAVRGREHSALSAARASK